MGHGEWGCRTAGRRIGQTAEEGKEEEGTGETGNSEAALLFLKVYQLIMGMP